jgi:hypothetical protein
MRNAQHTIAVACACLVDPNRRRKCHVALERAVGALHQCVATAPCFQVEALLATDAFPKLTVCSLLHKSDELTRRHRFRAAENSHGLRTELVVALGLSRGQGRAGFHARGKGNIDRVDDSKTASCGVISLKKGGTP